jgi:hypothetical protein
MNSDPRILRAKHVRESGADRLQELDSIPFNSSINPRTPA